MKLFVSDDAGWDADASSLNPLMAWHWHGVRTAERLTASNPDSPFAIVTDPQAADIHVLPFEWNHYIWSRRVDAVRAQAARAASHQRSLLTWHSGDLPPVVPFPNTVACQLALYRSRLKPHQHAVPSFEPDPFDRVHGAQVAPRKKRPKPAIGFCGYGGVVPLKIAYGIVAAVHHNLRSVAGRAPYEPIPLVPATLLRARVLRALAADDRLETKFVINTKAFKRHAGQSEAERRAEQTATFYQNLFGTDYTVCIRGYGNWSRRFYETLACGRIPIFVDTDCVLPGRDEIDWRRYCVWIDADDVPNIAARVLEFHQSLDDCTFLERQRACRQLWEDWLTPRGFMRHLPAQLGFAAARARVSSECLP